MATAIGRMSVRRVSGDRSSPSPYGDCLQFALVVRSQAERDGYVCPPEFERRGRSASPRRNYGATVYRSPSADSKTTSKLEELGESVASLKEFIDLEKVRREEKERKRLAKEEIKKREMEARQREEEERLAEEARCMRKLDKQRKREEEQLAMTKAVEMQLAVRLSKIHEDIKNEVRKVVEKGKEKIELPSSSRTTNEPNEVEAITTATENLAIAEKRKRGEDTTVGDTVLRVGLRSDSSSDVEVVDEAQDWRHVGRPQRRVTFYREPLQPDQLVAYALYRWASGETCESSTCNFGIGRASGLVVVRDVTLALLRVYREKIVWLAGVCKLVVLRAFDDKGFPNCHGCIDYTQIYVDKPANAPSENYYDRKRRFSIVAHVVVDLDLRMLDMHMGYLGGCHDIRVLQLSSLWLSTESGSLFRGPPVTLPFGVRTNDYVLVKNGYPPSEWMVVRYGGVNQHVDEERFDNKQKVARGAVDRAFSRLKGMRRLFLRTHKTNLDTLPQQFTVVVVDNRWKDTVWSTKKIRDAVAEVTACVGCTQWWKDMRALCKLLDPIMDMLQMVDSDTRQICKILHQYDEMIVRCLSACAAFEKDEQDVLLEVFDRRRTMFKSPAHVAAIMLDPEFRDRTMPDDEEMQHGLKLALIQFGYPEHSDQHNEVLTAIDKFHSREPPFDDMTTMAPKTMIVVMVEIGHDPARLGQTLTEGLTREQDIVTMRVALMHGAAEGPRDLQMVTPCPATGQEASTAQSRMMLEGPRDLQMVTPCAATGQEASTAQRHGGVASVPLVRVPAIEQIPVFEDSFNDHVDEERNELNDGSGHAPNDTLSTHAMALTGSSAAISELQQGPAPLMRRPESEGDVYHLPVMQDKGSAGAVHPLASIGATVSAAATSNVGRPPAVAEQESMLPPRSVGAATTGYREGVAMQQSGTHGADAVNTVSLPPFALMEGTDVACLGEDLPGCEISHTPAAEQSAADHVGLACPTDSLPGTGELLVMESALVSLPDLSTLISPSVPHVSPPNPQQPVAMERGPDAFDEFGGDTIMVRPMVSATLTIFRVGRPHEVDLGKAETTTRHRRDSHRSTAHRNLSDSFDGPEQAPMGGAVDAVERPATPPRQPSNSEHHPDSAAAEAVTGVPATNTADVTRQPVVGSSPTARRDTATVLAIAAFYGSGSSVGGLGKQGVRIVSRPCVPSMGTQSIGTVDGVRHTAMTEYEERYGSALPTKTSDVHATRVTKASLSRAKKRASERKASRSSPHMRSRIGRSGVVHLEDGEIAPDGDALDVGGRDATTANSVAMEGVGDGVAGQKRRGGVLIVHDGSTDVAPGETTCTDDAGDSDYVPTNPKLRAADGDDGGGRRTGMMEEGGE
ncbi:hypothetical protein CBR_g3715 [Chara braunii]|uniref:DDE Tnp4 domain-containing protein n=1 Tax=Chara braunii TaxID=69332 RepID=A0A388KG39_CHABU|nr:hypothetical protein CBR_g3715 [Chara braunii]|eukprot:GBG69015.1 hypothetical protein CBR_g3715 [Chara braunii]